MAGMKLRSGPRSDMGTISATANRSNLKNISRFIRQRCYSCEGRQSSCIIRRVPFTQTARIMMTAYYILLLSSLLTIITSHEIFPEPVCYTIRRFLFGIYFVVLL